MSIATAILRFLGTSEKKKFIDYNFGHDDDSLVVVLYDDVGGWLEMFLMNRFLWF